MMMMMMMIDGYDVVVQYVNALYQLCICETETETELLRSFRLPAVVVHSTYVGVDRVESTYKTTYKTGL